MHAYTTKPIKLKVKVKCHEALRTIMRNNIVFTRISAAPGERKNLTHGAALL